MEMLFKALDRDCNGTLSFREFIMNKLLIESNDLKNLIRFIFSFLDLTHDNIIEKKELLIFLKTINKTSANTQEIFNNEEFAEQMINDLDLNKNGQIDEDEFIEGVLKNKSYEKLIHSIKPCF